MGSKYDYDQREKSSGAGFAPKGVVDVFTDKAKGKVDHLADGTKAIVDKL